MVDHNDEVAGLRRRRRRQPSVRTDPSPTAWAAGVLSTADALDGELQRSIGHRKASGHGAGPHPGEVIVGQALARARTHADRPQLRVTGPGKKLRRTSRRLGSWWSGSDVDQAWGALHLAGQALLEIEPPDAVKAQVADIAAAVVTSLTPGDLRIKDYLLTLTALAPADRRITEPDRAQLRAIRQACDSSTNGAHADARAYRNTLILLGSLLAFALVVIATTASLDQDFRNAFGPSGGKDTGHRLVVELELVASLSGVTGALLSLSNYSGFQSTYGLPLVQAFLKGGTGAATGLLGVLLFQSGLITSLRPQDTVGGVFAVAVVFGYAQYLFTRLVDQQAKTVLTSASSRNDPGTIPVAPAGAATPDLLTTGGATVPAVLDKATAPARRRPQRV